MLYADGKAEKRASDNLEGEAINIDFNKRSIILPDFVAKLLSINAVVVGRDVRFACISPNCAEEGRTVMISYWADAERTINNVYLVLNDIEQVCVYTSN